MIRVARREDSLEPTRLSNLILVFYQHPNVIRCQVLQYRFQVILPTSFLHYSELLLPVVPREHIRIKMPVVTDHVFLVNHSQNLQFLGAQQIRHVKTDQIQIILRQLAFDQFAERRVRFHRWEIVHLEQPRPIMLIQQNVETEKLVEIVRAHRGLLPRLVQRWLRGDHGFNSNVLDLCPDLDDIHVIGGGQILPKAAQRPHVALALVRIVVRFEVRIEFVHARVR